METALELLKSACELCENHPDLSLDFASAPLVSATTYLDLALLQGLLELSHSNEKGREGEGEGEGRESATGLAVPGASKLLGARHSSKPALGPQNMTAWGQKSRERGREGEGERFRSRSDHAE